MNDWCVDSSVVAKWVLAEPDSAAALRVFIDSNAKGGKLFVLDLAILEVANAIRTRHHRGLLTAAEAYQALSLLQEATVQIVPSLPLLPQAFGIALRFDMSIYDALFVAAVRHLGTAGVTADRSLAAAVEEAYSEIKTLEAW